MNKGFLALAATLLAFGLTSTDTADAFSIGSGSRSLGTLNVEAKKRKIRMSRAPKAYTRFCLLHPSECRASGSGVVSADPVLMAKLKRVNRNVNHSILWTKDLDNVWQIGVRRGDCEDYALTKRSQLIKTGVPAGSLRMAVVKNAKGEGHAVLVVRTTSGDLVLDSVNDQIRLRGQTNYHWIGIASADPHRWQLL